MKCPHCSVQVHPAFIVTPIAQGESFSSERGHKFSFQTRSMTCPACEQGIIFLSKHLTIRSPPPPNVSLIYPKHAVRSKAAPEVVSELAQDFNEACLVLTDSPKASAALSRRCVQGVLRLQGYAQRDLAKAIDAILAAKSLPSSLAENLDAIRNIGNFAAHPVKDTNSGEIVEVEDHEADWNLDVLEGLFDFFYVQPARDAARKAALNEKLQGAGKPPMKGS